MKFRIMEDETGIYVQKKSWFGVWLNFYVFVNETTIFVKMHYCSSITTANKIMETIKQNNTKSNPKTTVLLEEFTV